MAIRSRWRYKYDWLTGHGMLPFESRELSRQYSMSQIRRLPYLRSMINSRMLTIRKFRKLGYTDKEIRDRVYALYDTKDWLTDGRPDIWQMLRKYRGASIDRHDYTPPRRKGSHHKGGISKGDLQSQRQRRHRKTELEKYEEGRGR